MQVTEKEFWGHLSNFEYEIEEPWEVEQYVTKRYLCKSTGKLIAHSRQYGLSGNDVVYKSIPSNND